MGASAVQAAAGMLRLFRLAQRTRRVPVSRVVQVQQPGLALPGHVLQVAALAQPARAPVAVSAANLTPTLTLTHALQALDKGPETFTKILQRSMPLSQQKDVRSRERLKAELHAGRRNAADVLGTTPMPQPACRTDSGDLGNAGACMA